MVLRSITAIIALIILLPFLIFSGQVPFLIPLMTAVLAVIAVFEYFRCVGLKRDLEVTLPGYLLAFACSIGTCFVEKVSTYLVYLSAALFVYLLYLYVIAIFRHGKFTYSQLSSAFTMVTYIAVCFACLPLIRHHVKGGEYLYLLVFVGSWVTDAFAYFVGKLFGRHKLNPEISPKKTVEGSIGGILCCVGAFALYGWILSYFFPAITPRYGALCAAGFFCSLVAQIGDLIASLIKREHGVKDFSNVFPGHGGVLDRFDSFLAVCPVLLFLCVLGDGALIPLAL